MKRKIVKKIVKRIRNPKPPLSPVERVRKFFLDAQAANQFRPVWNIISAMRGPDGGQDGVKAKYTTPLRRVVLIRSMTGPLSEGYTYETDKPLSPATVASLANLDGYGDGGSHFRRHIREAAEALQLTA